MNQHNAAGLESRHTFAAAFAERVQRIGHRVPCLTPSERQLVHDFSRQEQRYRFATLTRVLDLARRCTDAAEAEALAELVRGYVLAGRPQTRQSIDDGFDDETEIQAHADIMQRRFTRAPSPTTQVAVAQALHRQLVATRRALDLVHGYSERAA